MHSVLVTPCLNFKYKIRIGNLVTKAFSCKIVFNIQPVTGYDITRLESVERRGVVYYTAYFGRRRRDFERWSKEVM